MNTKQKDYLFERFCHKAKYIPLLEKYTVSVGDKALSSYDTEDLFKQYQVRKEYEK